MSGAFRFFSFFFCLFLSFYLFVLSSHSFATTVHHIQAMASEERRINTPARRSKFKDQNNYKQMIHTYSIVISSFLIVMVRSDGYKRPADALPNPILLLVSDEYASAESRDYTFELNRCATMLPSRKQKMSISKKEIE